MSRNDGMFQGGDVLDYYNEYSQRLENKDTTQGRADLYFKARQTEALERIAFVLEWYYERQKKRDEEAELYF